ncbi:MAG: DNA-binding protein [Lachnospiraceae bacterium]|jgi:predicted DNA-binding protein YlxM (UPF0122 family)|nr:DNA-binding protein [Eubacterium sp.]MCI6796196.1 DNA-binding protein [Lachnospiraceae bacterium]MDD6685583.1 DNA-binding protein [Lachnospiraceae bacterium]MDD7049057.1 DNA-binding protein [Lachnospiraceae bacterium]HBB60465.1 DNA-binding protein [Lachnospiraceae bacterium]
MESFVEKSLLFDFYGELLTEHQRRIFQEIVFNDYSAAEVARDEGISRQGVHDLMKRIEKTLEDYENRLHMVQRFLAIRGRVRKIQELTENPGDSEKETLRQIRAISSDILEEL